MIAAWMLWTVGVGALLFMGGLAAEKLLALYRKPARWVWLGAALGTVLLPLLRILWPSTATTSAEALPVPFLMDPLVVTVGEGSALRSLDEWLLLGWAALSGLMVLGAVLAGVSIWRRASGWESGELNGRPVMWSKDTGPAVVGLLRPTVVLPEWARDAGPVEQALVLSHEQEHIRAKDPQLRFLMGALVLLFPWNPAVWLHFHRIRLAIEMDCDSRVMARMPDRRRAYGDLLLQVGARGGGLQGLAVTALSEEPSLLERRIKRLVWRAPQARLAQAGILLFGGVLAVAMAMLAPTVRNSFSDTESAEARAEAEALDAAGRSSAGPTFTPFTVAPDITNRGEIQEALEAEYPPLLRDAGVGGTAKVWFYLSKTGELVKVELSSSSGHAPLDEAALRVARAFDFTPAYNRDEPVPVWVALDITFAPTDAPQTRELLGNEDRAPDEIKAQPTFTPFDVAPDLLNPSEVREALQREYPPLLKDAGIGGTATVWFLLSAEGVVEETRINESTGHEPLDAAALRVADVFRFSPGSLEGDGVPVWISLAITFNPNEEPQL